jgi:Na+/H+ antiporter NhaD/arsenite permease-like protein
VKQASVAVRTATAVVAALTATAPSALAAVEAPHLDGRTLGIAWVLPFIGILLSIAVFPLVAPRLWHRHYGKVSAFWALAFLVPFLGAYGPSLALHEVLHTVLLEYVPFIIVILALFTVAGGILVRGNLHGAPLLNTTLLAIGAAIASLVGTTGASMLLIRPLLRANDDRKHNVHTVVFFIFLVSNIGGALTPLGDPPLFLGFLQGVDFFWPARFLWQPTLLTVAILLALFYALDSVIYAREGHLPRDPTPDRSLALDGKINIALLAALVIVVLLSGLVPSLGRFPVFSVQLEITGVLRDAALVIIAVLSWKLTPPAIHEANVFGWDPALEVAKLFAGIFLTIIPALAILRAGNEGAMAPLLDILTGAEGKPDNAAYFWLTGGLSSFLDNAPTYLVFFHAAGGDAEALMGPLATTLMAISAGAVFMGANTYIGNAPNFMVKAIAVENGVRMPSFFGYMLWSGGILLPCFALVTWIFFR